MRDSFKTGVSFGLTSGIITTLGLIVGLHSGTHSKPVVIGGILTIAIADAFSDALGIHVSEESENRHSAREIWESTLATFAAKFFIASTFVAPILLWPLPQAIVASVAWGLALLVVFNFFLARLQGVRPWVVILEHVVIALIVITVTHFVGDWIGSTFARTPRPA
jgi:VIT1/CCC1 family predicted Fe2+/Mn2+ transporter